MAGRCTHFVRLLCAEFDVGGMNVAVTDPPHPGGIRNGIRDCGCFDTGVVCTGRNRGWSIIRLVRRREAIWVWERKDGAGPRGKVRNTPASEP